MKKSLIGVGAIIILGAAYVGASWYTGVQLETQFNQNLATFTEKLNEKQSLVHFAISSSDYQKGLFSSQVHLKIRTIDDSQAILANEQVIFDQTITLNHGPFPLSELSSGNFKPQMMTAKYDIDEAANPELWRAAGNKPYLHAKTRVDYNQNIEFSLTNDALNYQNESSRQAVVTSANKLVLTTDGDFSDIRLVLNIDQFKALNEESETNLSGLTLQLVPEQDNSRFSLQLALDKLDIADHDSQFSLIFDGINSQSQITLPKLANNFASDIALKIAQLSVIDLNNQLRLTDFSLNAQGQANAQQTIAGKANYNIAKINWGKQDLGSAELVFSYLNLPYNQMNALLGLTHPPLSEQNEAAAPVTDFTFSLDKFNWQTAVGNIDAKLAVTLSGDDLFAQYFENWNEDNIDSLNVDINVPFKVLTQIVAQVASPESDTVSDDAQKEAQTGLSMMMMMLGQSPVLNIITDPNVAEPGIYSQINYQASEAKGTLNGREYSKNQFFDRLK